MKKITYLEHSGFFLELETCCLLFDYWKGTIPCIDKPLYVFVSHVHQDHYNPDIFKLSNTWKQVSYILSDDINVLTEFNGVFVKPHQKIQLDNLSIHTLASTDEGVAFLVKAEDCHIFHSGDLHWWHWEEECTPEEKHTAKQAFLKEVSELKDIVIDIAFLVLDPRLDEQYGWGLCAFLQMVQIQHVFPMHFWGDFHVIKRFKEHYQTDIKGTDILELHHPQEEFIL